jgi:uncharacterized glyoxalase superfamily protein PhnB
MPEAITPYVLYEDRAAALEFLTTAFGFEEVLRHYVDDFDAHHERARAAGATIGDAPADQEHGDRRYHAEDPEGHSWFFAQRVRDVPPEEWGATVAS